MKIERSEENGVTVLVLEGVIRLGESALGFSAYLDDLLEEGVPAVLMDLSSIDYMDSTGLGEFVGYLQRFTEQGRRLALLNPQRRIHSLLKLTGLDRIFSVYENRELAIRELSE